MTDWRTFVTDNDWRDIRAHVAALTSIIEELAPTLPEDQQAAIALRMVHSFRAAILMAEDATDEMRVKWLNPAEYTPEQLS